jgi:hypothetical protein
MNASGSVAAMLALAANTGGRAKSATVSVDDRSGLITHAQQSYTNGGTLTFDHTYMNVGVYRLSSKADVAARFPGYSVDGTITFPSS